MGILASPELCAGDSLSNGAAVQRCLGIECLYGVLLERNLRRWVGVGHEEARVLQPAGPAGQGAGGWGLDGQGQGGAVQGRGRDQEGPAAALSVKWGPRMKLVERSRSRGDPERTCFA